MIGCFWLDWQLPRFQAQNLIQDDPKCLKEMVLRDMMPEKRGHILRWTCRHDPWTWLFRTLFLFFLQKGLPSKSWVILCFLWGGIRLNIPRPAEKVSASLARHKSFESSFATHVKPTFTRVCDFLNCCQEFCSRFDVLWLNGATNSRWARLLNENIMPTYEQLSTLLQIFQVSSRHFRLVCIQEVNVIWSYFACP